MQRSDGSLLGQKGVQYGLIKTGPKKPLAPAALPSRPPAIFGGDDSDEEDVEAEVKRLAEKKRSAARVQQQYAEALAEDPSVFDYDGVYDQMQQSKIQPKQQEKIERKSRYIAQLKEQAEVRKRENDINFERRQVKERMKEDHLFEDKEKFVTAAYRKKLEEDRLWQEREKAKELEEERNDVTKIGHMGNFYANLLTKNVAFGTSSATAAADKDKEKADAEVDGKTAGADKASSSSAAAAGSSGKQPEIPMDRYERLRLEAEQALKLQKQKEKEQGGTAGPQDSSAAAGASTLRPSAEDADDAEDANLQQPQGQGTSGSPAGHAAPGDSKAAVAGASGGEGEGAGEASAGPVADALAGKKRNTEDAVQAARERYLARKKQQTGAR